MDALTLGMFLVQNSLLLKNGILEKLVTFILRHSDMVIKICLRLKKTSNDIIAGNGRVLKAYMFIVGSYLFKKIFNGNDFFLSDAFIIT